MFLLPCAGAYIAPAVILNYVLLLLLTSLNLARLCVCVFALLQTIIVPVVILNYVFLVLLTSKTRSVSSLNATLFQVLESLAGGIFSLF
jgi:fumarate reductase subunit D